MGDPMFRLIDQFRRSRSGATAVEYALLATCIALAIIVAVGVVGTKVNATYATVSGSFQ
jgi:pilus assembly protein Flp/PilA